MVLLILALPVILIAMLAIAADDGLPILFTQQRTGRAGRTFNILKLRTMRKDAEGDGIARWAAAGDSRVTRVGRILRKLRIDELPQLINVLNGDMGQVVLIVAADDTPQGSVSEALATIENCPVVLTLLNKVSPGNSGNYYGSYGAHDA